jgi:hypothetical protein
MTTSLDQYPQRDGMYCILQDGVAVHNRYRDQVMMLDALSSELWLRADGETTLRTIAHELSAWSGYPVAVMLRTLPIMLVVLNSEGLMYQQDKPARLPYHLALPQEDQDADQMYESLAAAGWLDE